jgi:hypothetical protein
MLTSVVGQFSRNLAAPEAYVVAGTHQRCISQMVLGIWVRTFCKEELNKVEVGHDISVACKVQRRFVL